MMSRHFALSLELSGVIAKRLPHAKNQLSVPGSFFNQFVTYIYINKRASLACALRGWRTLCVRRRLPSVAWRWHWLIIREITSLNMSILVILLKPISLEKSPNLSILKFLMRNDDVITE